MDGALYFPLSKYGIEVRFRGSTRGEENQENKDHFICVFPLQLDKDILIHTCISQWFREFTQLVVFIFCYISLSVFSLFFFTIYTNNCQVSQNLRSLGHNPAQKFNNQSQLVLGKFHSIFANTNICLYI